MSSRHRSRWDIGGRWRGDGGGFFCSEDVLMPTGREIGRPGGGRRRRRSEKERDGGRREEAPNEEKKEGACLCEGAGSPWAATGCMTPLGGYLDEGHHLMKVRTWLLDI